MAPSPVLIVEDDAPTQMILERALQEQGLSPLVVENAEQAWEYYQDELFPLVILDGEQPDHTGLELCKRIRMREKSRFTTILLTGRSEQPDDLLTALEAGADDYLLKPFNVSQLKLRLTVLGHMLKMRVAQSLAEDTRRQALNELKRQACTDPLTGTHNRRSILSLGHKEFSRSRRYKLPFSLLVLDLVNLSQLNVRFGHQLGDQQIQVAARAIERSLRECDFVGRSGDDEFLILLPNTTPEGAASAAERLQSAITESHWPDQPTDWQPAAEIGVASFSVGPDQQFDQLLSRAQADLLEKENKL